MTERARGAEYGVDGYGYVIGLGVGGVLALSLGGYVGRIAGLTRRLAGAMLVVSGLGALTASALGVRYVLVGKRVHRDRVLDRIAWRGDERSLDVGTGGGLLAIGAARRAPRGRAVGIDVWDSADLSANSRDRALRNAEIESPFWTRTRESSRAPMARSMSSCPCSAFTTSPTRTTESAPSTKSFALSPREASRSCRILQVRRNTRTCFVRPDSKFLRQGFTSTPFLSSASWRRERRPLESRASSPRAGARHRT